MTDYTDLIERLRFYANPLNREAADALDAQARRIAELEERAALLDEHLSQAIGNLKKRDARIAELEAALKPVSELNALYVSPEVAAIIRAARAALEKKND